MERYFLVIIAFIILIIVFLSIKPIMRWVRALAQYGPAFLAGKRYLRHSLHLSEEVLYAGLECARQVGESLMKISLSYQVLNATDGFIVIWNNRWTYLIAMSKQQGRWCVRYTPDVLEQVNGIMDVNLSILYSLPEVGISGMIEAFGLIDVTGLTYIMQKCIDNIVVYHSRNITTRI